MALAQDHPLRGELNDEVHARPAEPLVAPAGLSYIALTSDAETRDRCWRAFARLVKPDRVDRPLPTHISADLGTFRLRLERHAEFIRLMVIVPGATRFDAPALAALPDAWRAAIEGQTLVAVHVALEVAEDAVDTDAIGAAHFGGNMLIGADIGAGAGTALTDFRIHDDGFSRMLVIDRGMTPRQSGRMVQRLLEVETYRMMALLAFPVARGLAPVLAGEESALAGIAAEMAAQGSAIDEPGLLDRLSHLQARIESHEAANQFRFAASGAYFALVKRRIAELRERRVAGLQTFDEFIGRRIAPAMATVAGIEARLKTLSERVARATQMIATRVALTQERQNQALLETMNARAEMQLRLQQTVEGISVAAITYYIIGLVGYAAKAAKAAGAAIEPEIVIGIMIPIVLLVTAFAIHRIQRAAGHDAPKPLGSPPPL